MGGELVFLFVTLGLGDMIRNHCPEAGCLTRAPAVIRIAGQIGADIFQDEDIGREVFLSLDLDRSYGPFQPVIAASFSSDAGSWAGIGARWQIGDDGFFGDLAFMPGIQFTDGPELGSDFLFRSALAVGYRFENGASLSFVIDHRSNFVFSDVNPGLETVGFRFSMPLD